MFHGWPKQQILGSNLLDCRSLCELTGELSYFWDRLDLLWESQPYFPEWEVPFNPQTRISICFGLHFKKNPKIKYFSNSVSTSHMGFTDDSHDPLTRNISASAHLWTQRTPRPPKGDPSDHGWSEGKWWKSSCWIVWNCLVVKPPLWKMMEFVNWDD